MLTNQKMNKNKGRLPTAIALCFLFIFLYTPFFLFAQIEITEIMYNTGENVGGSKADGGREWIEIYNNGTEDIDLNGWKLYEAETNHKITAVVEGGTLILPAGAYAIVADKPETFRIDWPNFSGLIFDSAFSLINKEEGEILIIRDFNLEDVSQVSYFPVEEADDTGNSLQKMNDGTWGACVPSPGAPTSSSCNSQTDDIVDDDSQTEEQPETASQTQAPTTVSQSIIEIEPQIFSQILPLVDTPIAGADFLFEAKAFGLRNKPLQNAQYQWTFGDGGKATGQKVLYAYQYPSDYLVVLQVISGKYTASSRLKIKTIPSDITVSKIGFDFTDNFIELYNPSTYELNLSWWRLKVDNNYFTIPKNTILLPKNRIKLSSKTTNLFPRENSQIDLLYPNGSIAFKYQEDKQIINSDGDGGKIGDFEKTANFAPNGAFTPIAEPFDVKSTIMPVSNPVQNSNQTAMIAGAIVDQESEEKDIVAGENGAAVAEGDRASTTPATRSPFNKWTFSFVGITALAIVGAVFATKLDK